MEYLLLIHIGPVQDFIATARRSRDLWFGSWLLSELSKAAALAVVKHEQNNLDSLIFPTPSDIEQLQPNSNLNVANKIVAMVSKPPDSDATGDYVQEAVWARLREIRRHAYESLNGSRYDKKRAKAQVDDLPEYFWVAVPFDENDKNAYSEALEQSEALILARKTTRNYERVTWGDKVPKSSLDGIRESVVPETAYPDRGAGDEIRQKMNDDLFANYGAKAAERLSGVDLLKRHGFKEHVSGFPSTSHIASLPLRNQITTKKPLWDAYYKILPNKILKQERVPPSFAGHPIFGNTDGSLLFESRLNEYLVGPELTEAKKQLRKFLQQATGGQTPLPYYALLLGDGDYMGRVLKAQKTLPQHQNFSRVLAEFAGQVQGIITNHQGALVYAGGDDVLAFVPLHTVLKCAQELAATFRKVMEDAQLKDAKDKYPTFSIGLAISHHLEPLSDALTLVRQTEREAKAMKGKNALAISVDKRSGVTRTVVGHWNDLDTRLENFTTYHQLDAIPDGAAYQLRDSVLRLGGEEVLRDDEVLQEVAQKEGIRILSRKRSQRGKQALDKDTLKQLKILLTEKKLSLVQLADELIIAGLLAKAKNQAGDTPEPEGGDE